MGLAPTNNAFLAFYHSNVVKSALSIAMFPSQLTASIALPILMFCVLLCLHSYHSLHYFWRGEITAPHLR